jgi:hypothetical protein
MKTAGIVAIALFIGINVCAQNFDVDTLLYNGNSDKHINLVILSDGYTENEFLKFAIDATNYTSGFFNELPYSNYRNYFNVFIIKVPSNESGASHPGTATDGTEPVFPVINVDNYFGSTFDYGGIHRLLVATKTAAISNVLAANFPNYDQVLILVNTPYYGGSGGYYTVVSTHSLSVQLALHELGHSFAGLDDEYWAGDQYAREGINMTKQTNPSLVRWKNWLGINLIGIYQHCCGGSSSQWYKPHQNCSMQYLNVHFCSVCIQAIIEKIHSLVTPIESYEPLDNKITLITDSTKFKLNLINPVPNTLRRNWILNGSFLKQTIDSVLIDESSLLSGTNTLKVIIEDTTQLLRVDNHATIHISSVSWTINNTLYGLNTLSVTPSDRDVGSEAGTTTFSISSNTSWTVSDYASWITVSPTSGSGDGTITATFTANPLTTSRVGTITISGTGVSSNLVNVIQSEPTIVDKLDDLKASIYPNPTKDFIFIKFDGPMAAYISISVVDEFGKSYYVNEYKRANFNKEKIIDLTSMKSGLYFLIIKSGNIIKTYKIIKE